MTDGPYPSEQDALQAKGGITPADSLLLPGQCANGAEQTWCYVSRISAVSGKDLRDAQASTDQNGQPSVSFSLTGEGGQRFYSFTSAHVGEIWRWCSTIKFRKWRASRNRFAIRARSAAGT